MSALKCFGFFKKGGRMMSGNVPVDVELDVELEGAALLALSR